MKTGKIKVFSALVAALLIITSLAMADGDDDKYVKDEQRLSESLSGINKVIVDITNGGIKAEISGGNNAEVLVYEKVRYNDDIDANDLLKEAKMVAKREGSALRLYIDYGKYKEHKKRWYYSSSVEIKLPARLAIEFDTTNGSIVAPAFDGDVKLDTTNGKIKSGGSKGSAVLDTTNGSIYVDAVAGTVVADTTNGSIYVSDFTGKLVADTTNGNVEINLKKALSGDIEADTTNGSIIFAAGSGSSYKLEADTSHGKVRGPDSLKYNKRRNTASGTMGGGKYKVVLDTTNGSITIK